MTQPHHIGPQTTGSARPTLPTHSAHALDAVPAPLVDVALIDAKGIVAAACVSVSTWHELVRTGKAPQPVMRAPRCTRWRVADIRDWLLARSVDVSAAEKVDRAARAGAEGARRRRQQAAPSTS